MTFKRTNLDVTDMRQSKTSTWQRFKDGVNDFQLGFSSWFRGRTTIIVATIGVLAALSACSPKEVNLTFPYQNAPKKVLHIHVKEGEIKDEAKKVIKDSHIYRMNGRFVGTAIETYGKLEESLTDYNREIRIEQATPAVNPSEVEIKETFNFGPGHKAVPVLEVTRAYRINEDGRISRVTVDKTYYVDLASIRSETIDMNGDGKPDFVQALYDGKDVYHATQTVDVDFDGKPEIVQTIHRKNGVAIIRTEIYGTDDHTAPKAVLITVEQYDQDKLVKAAFLDSTGMLPPITETRKYDEKGRPTLEACDVGNDGVIDVARVYQYDGKCGAQESHYACIFDFENFTGMPDPTDHSQKFNVRALNGLGTLTPITCIVNDHHGLFDLIVSFSSASPFDIHTGSLRQMLLVGKE